MSLGKENKALSDDLGTLVRLGKSDIKPASKVLAKAFQKHPILMYFIPDASTRRDKLHYVFEKGVRYGVLYGEVYATSSNLEGVAIILPSETADMTLWRMLRVGMFFLFFRLGGDFIKRGLRIASFLSSVQKRCAPSRYWLFQFLGIDPEHEGKGHAVTLAKAMLSRIDKENLPCYFDIEEEEKVRVYQRYGFRVVEELTIPGTNIRVWAMLRDKRS